MTRRRREPQWLSRTVIDAIHSDQVREHGGLAGLRDENGLEAALARPRQKWHYNAAIDLPALAAAYAFGLITNHPYRDGNKRIGFLAMVTFLEMHGLGFTATDAEVVAEILAVASGIRSEDDLTAWVRQHSSKYS
ncbi:MAG: type II toxin-antitoxin system death-on-curing family toxin [Vicinamibacterales bacterium]